ncbi:MAG: lysostaphin resistance A-like protein [Flavobacteriales bacterium]
MKLALLFIMAGCINIISNFLGSFLAELFWNIEVFGNREALMNLDSPEAISAAKFQTLMMHTGLMVIPSLIFPYVIKENTIDYLKLNQKIYSREMILTIILMIALLPIIKWLGDFNSKLSLPDAFSSLEKNMRDLQEKARKMTESFIKMNSFSTFLLNLFIIAIIPAIGEEFLFRGLLQKLIGEWTKNIHIGIFVSAILFSALHFQFFGFLPRMFLGVIFGYLFIWSGTIWLPIFAHFINNGAAVFFSYLEQSGKIDSPPEKEMGQMPFISVILGILISGGILYLIKKNKQP